MRKRKKRSIRILGKNVQWGEASEARRQEGWRGLAGDLVCKKSVLRPNLLPIELKSANSVKNDDGVLARWLGVPNIGVPFACN